MKIIDATAMDNFQVSLRFEDGATGIVDLSPLAGRGVFSAWLEDGVFEQLSISANGALQWPGELDLCPDALYLQMTDKTASEVFPALQPPFVHA